MTAAVAAVHMWPDVCSTCREFQPGAHAMFRHYVTFSSKHVPSTSALAYADSPALPARPPAPQIAKLLVIPFVCFVERFFLGAVFSRQVLATIMVVVLGVGIV